MIILLQILIIQVVLYYLFLGCLNPELPLAGKLEKWLGDYCVWFPWVMLPQFGLIILNFILIIFNSC